MQCQFHYWSQPSMYINTEFRNIYVIRDTQWCANYLQRFRFYFFESASCMSIIQYITEDCLRVQKAGSADMHVLSLDAALMVETIPYIESDFPESLYEVVECNIRNQPTIIDCLKRSRNKISESSGSQLQSRPCSAISRSTVSSRRSRTSYSSIDTDGGAMASSPIVESESSYFMCLFSVWAFLTLIMALTK